MATVYLLYGVLSGWLVIWSLVSHVCCSALSLFAKGRENFYKQLIIPTKYRERIIEKGHTDTFTAHLGITRTKQRIAQNFYWPGMEKQIKSYCQRCDTCQRQGTGNNKTKAKLCPLPIISTPFQRLGLEIVGQLPEVMGRGNCFILTIHRLCHQISRRSSLVQYRDRNSGRCPSALYVSHGFCFWDSHWFGNSLYIYINEKTVATLWHNSHYINPISTTN